MRGLVRNEMGTRGTGHDYAYPLERLSVDMNDLVTNVQIGDRPQIGRTARRQSDVDVRVR